MHEAPDFAAIVNASPYFYLMLAPDLTIMDVNDAYVKAAGRTREALVGRNVFDAFPPTPDNPEGADQFRASFARVMAERKPDTIALVKYAIPDPDTGGNGMVDRYWSIVHTPILDGAGEVTCIVQNPIDVTELYTLKKALRAVEQAQDFRFRTEGSLFSRSRELEETNRMLDAKLNDLRRLFEQAPGFVAVVRGPEFVFDMANEAYQQLVGHRQLVGRAFRDILPELDGQGFIEIMDEVLKTGKAFVGRGIKATVQRETGGPKTDIYIDLVVQPITDTDGTVFSLFVQGHDITAQKRAEDALRISNERWKLAIEGTGDGVWDWDMQSNEVTYSARWKDMLGYAEHEIGNTVDEWRNRLHPDDAAATLALLHECIDGKVTSFKDEHRLRCKDGTWKWVMARAIVVTRDERRRPLRLTGTMTDISAKKESDERIWRHANFDTLTGLPNRRLFRDRLDQEVRKAHRTGMQAALLFIDLDRFKEVNDLLGHDAGDLLLTQVARRLGDCVRESDTVARLGGDEFTVILTELDDEGHVEILAKKILDALHAPFHLGNEVAYVSGSIGITMYPNDAGNPEELIRNADQAMYAAKAAGRDQFSFFTRSMQEHAHARLRLSGDLRNALGEGQLCVHFQPVVDLQSGRIVKAEALLRWQHPSLGAVEPVEFIPLAEESGMINEIGDWVFRQAADCSLRWSAVTGAPFQVGVNKSPVQFLTQGKEDNWTDYLQQHGMPGGSITVEITEGLLLNASSSILDRLIEYRDAGIELAIDDFGTGYSSLAYLKKFDIDYLKIDQSFVRDIAVDEGDRAIAESMIVMAHRLGLKVIAEGIETQEQWELLRNAGCDFGQGFLYAAPAPAEEFERLLSRGAVFH
ncbi:EAL and GGDEF domain-containing protein [Noviherbaspirillum sp. ST9]|uniref:sensor domain-containing protein n=1 Tax=Noviherbaspirillum sp. ST9 TaxID=3401606 RepID=UPI003B589EEB